MVTDQQLGELGQPDLEPADVAPVRPGEDLDWSALDCRVRELLLDLRGPLEVRQFPHGNANLTYLLRFDSRELVLRRPPFGELAPGAHDMKREYRVLSKLWRVYDRAPQALAFCDDHEVIGSDFVVLERRVGEVVRDAVPASMANVREVGRRLGHAVVDALAELNCVDPAECGLQDLGRPDGFVARQVAGWRHRWELARPQSGPEIMDRIGARLADLLPRPQRASLLHNDMKLDNCQFPPGDPDRVSAVFDWDMATVGDPLVDLGTLLNYWPDPADPPDSSRVTHDGLQDIGLPSRLEIAARYGEQTGLDTEGIAWYEAFALWKTAIVVQQLWNRYVAGDTLDDRMIGLGERVPMLARSAAEVVDGLV